jgi:predicted acylesterase/phospholipase RssA
MVIKHIVIAGGGPTGLVSYGALKYLNEVGVWKREELETVYTSSIGGFIGVLATLNYKWKVIDDYIIERPWEKAFAPMKNDILEIMYNKGINGKQLVDICLTPLLTGLDLSPSITMREHFEHTNIELVFTATEINNDKCLQGELISYKSYPDMELREALACTLAFPMLFKPVFVGEKCFVDGGLIHNYPLNHCLHETKCAVDEVLAFNNIIDGKVARIEESSSFIEYTRMMMNKFYLTLETSKDQPEVPNSVVSVTTDLSDMTVWFEALTDRELKEKLVMRGVNDGINFFTKKTGETD